MLQVIPNVVQLCRIRPRYGLELFFEQVFREPEKTAQWPVLVGSEPRVQRIWPLPSWLEPDAPERYLPEGQSNREIVIDEKRNLVEQRIGGAERQPDFFYRERMRRVIVGIIQTHLAVGVMHLRRSNPLVIELARGDELLLHLVEESDNLRRVNAGFGYCKRRQRQYVAGGDRKRAEIVKRVDE